MAESGALYLIEAETGERFGPLRGNKGDVVFPEKVRGWGDVLDCRHKPYTDKTIEELRHYTRYVHKYYFLISDQHAAFALNLPPTAPSTTADEAEVDDDDEHI